MALAPLLSASARLAPPARPLQFARTASAVVIGRFVSQSPVGPIDPGVDERPIAMTFTVDEVVKMHANASPHPRATLASLPPPDHVTILREHCYVWCPAWKPEGVSERMAAAVAIPAHCCDGETTILDRLEPGRPYLLFISWNPPVNHPTVRSRYANMYSLHYGNYGVFRLDRDAGVPIEDSKTDLLQHARSVSKATFLHEVRAGAQTR